MNTKLTTTQEIYAYFAVMDDLSKRRIELRRTNEKYYSHYIIGITTLRHLKRLLQPTKVLGVVVSHQA